MTSSEGTIPRAQQVFARGTVLFTVALAFSLMPMIGKLLSRGLGGSIVAWTTALVFFHFAGFAALIYANLLQGSLTLRKQVLVNAALMLATLVLLQLSVDSPPLPTESPVMWVWVSLSFSVGAPLALLLAGPVLAEGWLGRRVCNTARTFVWGGGLGLVIYTLVVEPQMGIATQTRWWSAAFGLAATGIAAVGWVAGRAPADARPIAPPSASKAAPIRSFMLAALPAGLLVSVTRLCNTEVTSVPALWVAPLLVYLASFGVARSGWRLLDGAGAGRALVVIVAVQLALLGAGYTADDLAVPIVRHLGVLFVVALALHAELLRRRDEVEEDGSFRQVVVFGALCGSLFVALLAPLLFPIDLEYPVMLAGAAALVARRERGSGGRLPLGLALVLFVGVAIWLVAAGPSGVWPAAALVVFGGGAMIAFERRPALASAVLMVFATAVLVVGPAGRGNVRSHRSYFGVYEVGVRDQTRYLLRGGRTQGTQSTDPAAAALPTAHYAGDSVITRYFEHLASDSEHDAIGVLGGGVGAAAAYDRPDLTMVFYDVDPLQTTLSADPANFTFLEPMGRRLVVIAGDPRLRLSAAPPRFFHLIIADAITADPIGVHLLTREALATYLSKLRRHGSIAFHLDDRGRFDLLPFLARSANDLGAEAVVFDAEAGGESRWLFVTNSSERTAQLVSMGGTTVRSDPQTPLWTDDEAHLLDALR